MCPSSYSLSTVSSLRDTTVKHRSAVTDLASPTLSNRLAAAFHDVRRHPNLESNKFGDCEEVENHASRPDIPATLPLNVRAKKLRSDAESTGQDSEHTLSAAQEIVAQYNATQGDQHACRNGSDCDDHRSVLTMGCASDGQSTIGMGWRPNPTVYYRRSDVVCLNAAQSEALQTLQRSGMSGGSDLMCPRPGCSDRLRTVDALKFHLHIHNIGTEIDSRSRKSSCASKSNGSFTLMGDKSQLSKHVCPYCHEYFKASWLLDFHNCRPLERERCRSTSSSLLGVLDRNRRQNICSSTSPNLHLDIPHSAPPRMSEDSVLATARSLSTVMFAEPSVECVPPRRRRVTMSGSHSQGHRREQSGSSAPPHSQMSPSHVSPCGKGHTKQVSATETIEFARPRTSMNEVHTPPLSPAFGPIAGNLSANTKAGIDDIFSPLTSPTLVPRALGLSEMGSIRSSKVGSNIPAVFTVAQVERSAFSSSYSQVLPEEAHEKGFIKGGRKHVFLAGCCTNNAYADDKT